MLLFFFFKQKTAYEIVSRDWSSDVCSSDLCLAIPENTKSLNVLRYGKAFYTELFVHPDET